MKYEAIDDVVMMNVIKDVFCKKMRMCVWNNLLVH